MSACSICSSERCDELEALGLAAMKGESSWRAAAQAAGLTHHKGLQNHMEKHYVAPMLAAEAAADDALAVLIKDSLEELSTAMAHAPAEVKPLYAVAIRNLAGLRETKPSQQHLIAALKTIHEVTGMRMEQRLMLDFARAHFGQAAGALPAPAPVLPAQDVPLALEAMRDVLEAEVVE